MNCSILQKTEKRSIHSFSVALVTAVIVIVTLPAYAAFGSSTVLVGQKGGRPNPSPTPTIHRSTSKPEGSPRTSGSRPRKKSITTSKIIPAKGTSPPSRQSPCSANTPREASGRTHTVSLALENDPLRWIKTDSVTMHLVEIPPGSFCMGSTDGSADEKPVHQVTINYSFYLGKYEVTQAQWQAVMGSNPSTFKDCANCPVEQVSWDDAQNFINKLNEGNDGFRYRLPTEAEWEYACRAGTTGDYAGNLSEMAWYSDNSGNETHLFGGKRPNDWGLADMHGNVWEWCQDWYHETYYGAPTDGSAWLSGGEQKYRVLRGGSWLSNAAQLRSAFRYAVGTPDNRSFNFGFRLVAVVRTP